MSGVPWITWAFFNLSIFNFTLQLYGHRPKKETGMQPKHRYPPHTYVPAASPA